MVDNKHGLQHFLKKTGIYFTSVLFLCATVSSILGTYVSAQEQDTGKKCDQSFYSSNNILFYDPCATICGEGTGAASTAKINQLRGNNNAERIFNFWIDAGLTSQQAAGITGSMKHEGGFSPFRQEMDATWPDGGWGIAQFTHDPGQRGAAKQYVISEIGNDLFNQYYKNDYGGAVLESNGFVPQGVPDDVNQKFLLAQLNYLLGYISSFQPSSINDRVDGLKADYGQDVPASSTLFDYLHTLVQAPDAAIAWTYLYEYPGDIKNTAQERANSATEILALYSNGISSSCGGPLKAGGMNLEDAKKFMEEQYKKDIEDSKKYLGGAAQDCPGGPLANCVSFTAWFINKYTDLQGFSSPGSRVGNGGEVVGNVVANNPSIQNGHSPQPYAIFSTYASGGRFGHTGIILGVDTQKGVVIVGEAACSDTKGMDWITAREYPLAEWSGDAYTYAYTNGHVKGL